VRVVHVAHAGYELPEEVRQWLKNASNSAYASPDIYDTLALLAQGNKPAAIIIGIAAVDWNELEFFDLSRRLSPETNIYVTGNEHQRDKIDAACTRGAKRFVPALFNKDISRKITAGQDQDYSMGGLLAGSLRTAGTEHKQIATPESVPQDKQSDVPTKTDADEPNQKMVIRLLTPKEHDQEIEKTIPFPWAPSSKRPKRTPPAPSATPIEQEKDAKSTEKRKPLDVELTSEELAALRGEQPDLENNANKEQNL
jgi:hypothetical protein